MNTAPLSVFVMTYNEERNLAACLESLAPWADEIFVVDSLSTDRTAEIAASYGAKVVPHAFEGHSRQRNWALEHLPFRNPWVLALDADHRVTAELRDELIEKLPAMPEDICGLYVKRRVIFRGRWIRFGGYYPKWMLKVFRRGKARCDDDEFDYRFYIDGKTARLQHDILEDNLNEYDIGFWIAKHNKFASEQAAEELKRRAEHFALTVKPRLWGSPDQRVLWLKMRYYQAPRYLRPFVYFFYRYFWKLGILDGKQGFIFHFLQAFWFRLLVDIKIDDLLAAGQECQSSSTQSGREGGVRVTLTEKGNGACL